jgi:putative transcription factor|uniref:HTH cro/C1-type domain-containing protein n=1 Tax=viral metagenome TaxID=1070528 RepID=A0A6C0CZ04_9ZZZZ
MNCQDWTPVIIGKKTISSKPTHSEISYVQKKQQKLDADNESVGAPPTVTHNFRLALQNARMAKKLSQEQLAQKIGIKKDIIQSYESGRAIPNAVYIQKMQNALGCVLPKN